MPRLITVAISVMSGHVYLLWIFSRHLFQYFNWNHVEIVEFLSPFYNYWQSMLCILFLFCLALWIFVTYTVFLSILITSFRYHIRIYLTPNRNPLNKKTAIGEEQCRYIGNNAIWIWEVDKYMLKKDEHTSSLHKLRFYYYHCVKTSAGWPLVP